VTAGDDMGLSEYGDVGDTISTYADDDATIVVGTVIDPSLGNELRVTLVATGLHAQLPSQFKKPVQDEQVVDLDQFKTDVNTQRQRPVRNLGEIVDDAVASAPEQPIAEAQPKKVGNAAANGISQEDLIEIPAFLRKQAD